MKPFENLFLASPSPTQELLGEEALRAGGVLLLPSLALLIEGTTRFVSNSPADIGGDLTRVQEANMACAIFYVMLGYCGLVTGASILIGCGNKFMAQGTLILQLTIGVVAFANFVVAVPLTAYNKGTLPLRFPDGEFTPEEELGLTWLGGVLMSFFLCASVQGLQIACTTSLVLHQLDIPPVNGPWCHYVLLVFLIIVLIGGIGEFIFGSIARSVLGFRSQEGSLLLVASNVVTYSNIPLVTGILLLIYGFLLAVPMMYGAPYLALVNGFAVVLLTWFLSAYVMTNIGLAGPIFSGTAAIVTALSTTAILAPVFIFNEVFRIEGAEEKSHAAVVAELDAVE